MRYKRNQIDEAFARLATKTDGARLRSKVRRLLDIDRRMGRDQNAPTPEERHYAFYGDDPQGSGNEVWYTFADAFALLLAVQLELFGLPQKTIIKTLRTVKGRLSREVTRILKLDPKGLFAAEAIQRAAKPGDIATSSTQPIYLAVARPETDTSIVLSCEILMGEAAYFRNSRTGKYLGQMVGMVELTRPAHRLAEVLAYTKPNKRGPAPS